MDGDSMTFEQLYHFLEVYHYGSITKAAQNLSVSRQAVAGSIKKLESEFGVELFERSAGGAVPTSPGEEFYTHASIIVREAAALRQNLLAFTTQCSPCSVCKIGLAESLLYNIGEELLEILSTTFPDVYFDISAFTYDPTTPHQYQLYDFSAPILFDSQYNEMMDVDDEDYIVSELAHFPASVWISADSPLAQYESLTFAQLGDMPYCMLKNSYNMSNMLHRLTEYFTEKPAQGTEVYLKTTSLIRSNASVITLWIFRSSTTVSSTKTSCRATALFANRPMYISRKKSSTTNALATTFIPSSLKCFYNSYDKGLFATGISPHKGRLRQSQRGLVIY